MEKMKVRTRFAPSPTGFMHVGNLRSALYAYLFARQNNGTFILRIEDTDLERFVPGAVEVIYDTLKQAGIEIDEGPHEGGNYGPYVQSERKEIYQNYAKELVDKGVAYYCFCDKERLANLKAQGITKYDKHCLHLPKEEIEKKLASGEPYVIRQNMPTEGVSEFEDLVFGKIQIENKELEDHILIKSDGYPTYNFANVVDDHLMEITHVVRGNEYLSSTPKYTRLYQDFGWDEPVYIHLPLITNEDHKKLSKRSGHSSYEDLIEQGFLSEAIINFVALLGWSSPNNIEIMSLEELIKEFDYRNINKSPAVFDMVKLRWMNGEYIKKMDGDEFYRIAEPYIKAVVKRDIDTGRIAELVKTRIETLCDIGEKIDFFEELPEYDVEMFTHKKMKTNSELSLNVLTELLPKFEALDDYSEGAIETVIMSYIAEKGI